MNYFSFSCLLVLCGTAVGQCPLCYDGSDPPNPSFVPGGRLDELTCESLAYGASVPDPEDDGPTCEDWLLIGFQCGCPVPSEGCSLCYDGSLPPAFDKEVLNSTCGIFTSAAGSPSSDEQAPSCDQWLQIGLLCDCPVPEGACQLCEDGSAVPNPELMVGTDKCSDVTALASFSEGDECSAWQATAGVYCGCINPVASEGYCRICGDGKFLPDPGFVPLVGDNTQRNCGQIEFNREGIACDELQSQYGDACCSAAPVGSKAPSVAPAGNGTASAAPVGNGATPAAPVGDGATPVAATPVNPSPVDSDSPSAPTTPPSPPAPASSAATVRKHEYLMAIIAAVALALQ